MVWSLQWCWLSWPWWRTCPWGNSLPARSPPPLSSRSQHSLLGLSGGGAVASIQNLGDVFSVVLGCLYANILAQNAKPSKLLCSTIIIKTLELISTWAMIIPSLYHHLYSRTKVPSYEPSPPSLGSPQCCDPNFAKPRRPILICDSDGMVWPQTNTKTKAIKRYLWSFQPTTV